MPPHAVLSEGHDREADHLRAAAGHRQRRPRAPSARAPRKLPPLEIGSVSAMPTIDRHQNAHQATDCRFVAHLMKSPTELAAVANRAARTSTDSPTPTRIVTRRGDENIHLRLLADDFAAFGRDNRDEVSTASGPPAPPSLFAAMPTAIRLYSTNCGAESAAPMDTAMAGPATCWCEVARVN